ncbi:MAG: hypothetical protein A3F84_08395 [Candidatus Handelsmanbacteria bacterium RIFCSPLOWO2_12_FULL_64_10]|uniref:SWIM-type domain-containing protein n=1 Tax=Handelsmanbacteria sp. (strain RIFCSPLOWO2_12_FULL_64_10) TaxID=1817868 RepID=A0A1F6D5B2_HANXR|nr:MAG: hypothetical protein A3F84_08395 [Candidatus Handelsmanbacteria bacterium RIFCSPLOWO2_12_FULL_64_10]
MSTFRIDAPGYTLTHLSPGTWRISSPSGRAYTVHPEAGTCTCPDAQARGHRRACKHLRGLWALLKLMPALGEEALDRAA